MNESSFLDAALPLLQGHLESLWLAADRPKALYARGSAILPAAAVVGRPWDIDFILFVSGDLSVTSVAAIESMRNIRSHAPSLPPPDILVVPDRHSFPQCLHALLVLSGRGRLLMGNDLRMPASFFEQHMHAIRLHVQQVCAGRIDKFVNCETQAEQFKRMPHLGKSVLRLGGFIDAARSGYSREPQECATRLRLAFPQLREEITLIQASLVAAVAPDRLTHAVRQMLLAVSREGANELY